MNLPPTHSGMLSGMAVYVDHEMCDRVQVRFPKTKKKRIRKKWAKRPENFRSVPRMEIVRVGNRLVCHPVVLEQINRAVESIGRAAERRMTKMAELSCFAAPKECPDAPAAPSHQSVKEAIKEAMSRVRDLTPDIDIFTKPFPEPRYDFLEMPALEKPDFTFVPVKIYRPVPVPAPLLMCTV